MFAVPVELFPTLQDASRRHLLLEYAELPEISAKVWKLLVKEKKLIPEGPPTNDCVPAPLSRLLHEVFCASPLPPVLELANRIFPPALKKNLACSAVVKVIDVVELTD